MIKNSAAALLLAFSLLVLVLPAAASAQQFTNGGGSGFTNGGGTGFTNGGGSGFTNGGGCGSGNGTFRLCNPLSVDNFCDLVKKLLDIVLAIGVPIAVLFLVWAGFRFILARGSQTGLADAKKNFMYVIIGIAIFLGAWTLATVISATVKTLDSSGTIQFCGR